MIYWITAGVLGVVTGIGVHTIVEYALAKRHLTEHIRDADLQDAKRLLAERRHQLYRGGPIGRVTSLGYRLAERSVLSRGFD